MAGKRLYCMQVSATHSLVLKLQSNLIVHAPQNCVCMCPSRSESVTDNVEVSIRHILVQALI